MAAGLFLSAGIQQKFCKPSYCTVNTSIWRLVSSVKVSKLRTWNLRGIDQEKYLVMENVQETAAEPLCGPVWAQELWKLTCYILVPVVEAYGLKADLWVITGFSSCQVFVFGGHVKANVSVCQKIINPSRTYMHLNLLCFLSLKKKFTLLIFLALGLRSKKFGVFLTIYSEMKAQVRKNF